MKFLFTFAANPSSLYSQNRYDMPMRAYIDGADVLTFKTEALEVELAAYLVDKMYGPGKEVNLHLQLKNTGDVPVDFNPSKMVAYMIKKGKKVEVDVYSASDYLFKVDNSIIWYGPSNEETMTSTTTVKGRDGRTIKSVESETKRYTGERDAAYMDAEDYVNSNYVRRNTVFPGQQTSGLIVIGNTKQRPFEVHLPLNGDIFIFEFDALVE